MARTCSCVKLDFSEAWDLMFWLDSIFDVTCMDDNWINLTTEQQLLLFLFCTLCKFSFMTPVTVTDLGLLASEV